MPLSACFAMLENAESRTRDLGLAIAANPTILAISSEFAGSVLRTAKTPETLVVTSAEH